MCSISMTYEGSMYYNTESWHKNTGSWLAWHTCYSVLIQPLATGLPNAKHAEHAEALKSTCAPVCTNTDCSIFVCVSVFPNRIHVLLATAISFATSSLAEL